LGDYVIVSVGDYYDNGVTGSIWYEGNVYAMPGTFPAIDGALYEIVLDIYSFKVQNLMQDSTLASLYDVTHTTHWDQYIQPGEIVEYQLAAGTYSLEYHNSELGINVVESITIAGAAQYIMNTSYHTIFFSCFSNDGLGVPVETCRLFVNQSSSLMVRVPWGPVELLGITNVTVLDYLNDTQYSAIVDLSHVTEMCIFVNIATVITNNLMRNESIALAIYKYGILLQNQTIGPASGLYFRFTNGNYTVNCTYANGTIETRSVEVIANSSDLKTYTLNFGHYTDPLPQEIPKPGFQEIIILIACILIAVVIAVTIFALYQRSRRLDAERFQFEVNKRKG